ncbi:hypothetical protein [Streptomyces montanisoli]|uniref:Uncharacterized protein n=1 Tax=Streptomyces montanisoli TaxID=2798581 RepID=A0A940MCN6_9ACTN|nr:hypothetical protein [Streptomyces montanisoli]MBP0456258.1 hypothetical protein [Streptomyces montanisoli]
MPQDVLDRIASLEREIRELRGRSQIRPALDQILHGKVTIGEGGSLDVRAPNGAQILGVGQFANGRYGIASAREDGTGIALQIGGNSTDLRQMIRVYPRGGYPNGPILMDDAYADGYLGRPWMPIQLHPTARQGGYTGTAYDFAWVGISPVHNAVLYLHTSTYANTGGAQARVVLTHGDDETTLDEWDCAANGWTDRNIVHPLDGVPFLDFVNVQIEHRNKTSGQNCETRVFSAYTRNTLTADETPDAPFSAASTTEKGA